MKLDDIEAELPPIYTLVHLMLDDGLLEPRVPVQMMYSDLDKVDLRSFGRVDIYPRFHMPHIPLNDVSIWAIKYRIIVYGGAGKPGVTAEYSHKFAIPVTLGSQGCCLSREDETLPLVEFYSALEHLPKLPGLWRYFQFVH